MRPVKLAGLGHAAHAAPPLTRPGEKVPDAQMPHVGADRSMPALPNPGLQASQSERATAAIVSVVVVPAGQAAQAESPRADL